MSAEVRGGPRRSVGVRGDQRESMEVCGVPRWSTGATEVLGASKKVLKKVFFFNVDNFFFRELPETSGGRA